MWPISCLLALGACGFEVNGGTPPGDGQPDAIDAPGTPAQWLPGFTRRKPIDLTGAPTELVNFVASITRDTDPDLAGSTTLAFTASDGVTALPAEIVVFDGATGKLEASVRTTLAANAKTRIFVYYGDGPALLTTLPWGPLYAGVWHMGSVGGMTEIARDSKKLHDATATPSDIPLVVTGILGEARQFDGSNDSMTIPDPPDGSLDFGATTSFSVGLWVKVTQSVSFFDMPFYKGGSSAGVTGYDFELGGGAWWAGFSDGTADPVMSMFGDEVNLLGEWHYLVSQCDRDAAVVRTFLDGAKVDEQPFMRGSVSNASFVRFGEPTYRFRGQLDEIRIYTGAISADWIATEYKNLANRAAFQNVLPAELRE